MEQRVTCMQVGTHICNIHGVAMLINRVTICLAIDGTLVEGHNVLKHQKE